MAEPPAVARAGVAVSGRDVRLATKLYVPGPRPGFVPRPRLADRLEEGLARGLVLVCAPAGSGKTVLLADWARRLRTAVIFAAARGAATATGSGLAGLALWWLTHHSAHLLAYLHATAGWLP